MLPSRILPCPQLINKSDHTFLCCKIGAASFAFLIKKTKSDRTVHLFTRFMKKINNEIALVWETNTLDLLTMNEIKAKADEKELLNKLPPEYHELKDVFDWAEANKLPPYRFTDHRIKLTSKGVIPSQSRAYKILPYKLIKVKKYLTDMFEKRFIMSSKAAYSFPVLFTVKVNEDLQFCVNYWKLNVIIKWNCYPLPLIKKIIKKLCGCKHFI